MKRAQQRVRANSAPRHWRWPAATRTRASANATHTPREVQLTHRSTATTVPRGVRDHTFLRV
jgi:hypothetical protein